MRVPVVATVALWALSAAAQGAEWGGAADNALLYLLDGSCEKAAEHTNTGLGAGDPAAYYLAGMMFNLGLCVQPNAARAKPLLETAAKHRHAGAARALVVIHGIGRGVEQSYAEAGRWAVAVQDISRLASAAADSAPDLSNGRLDADWAARLGYLATVHLLSEERIAYPKQGVRRSATSVDVAVTVSIPGPSVSVEAKRTGNDEAAGSTGPFAARVRETYDQVIRDLPLLMARSGEPLTLRMDFRSLLR